MFQIETKMNPTGFPPVADTLPRAVERIVSVLKPEKIILFGSYASGDPNHDSDVDLLVIMKLTGDYKEKYRAISMLLYPRQFPVDIILKTPKDVADALKGGKDNSFFIREILKKGKILYDRNKRT
ncbi:MAG: nucleotidyltransferase domain-containing protein [Chloroflexota bacterium]|jgi:predicted nucleotidyltransferase